jgi:two-component system, OmpR family, response regulator
VKEQPLERILLVEDDPDIRVVTSLALSKIGGFEVRVSGSAPEALRDAPGFAPDLILLDVMMPGMDGPSTLAALRGLPSTATTPVIFMTAKIQPHEMAHYRKLGSAGVIAKPFDPATLAQRVRELWKEYHNGSAQTPYP